MNASNCIFCNFATGNILEENEFAFAAYFGCAIRNGHIVVALKQHVESLSHLTQEQAGSLLRLAARVAGKAEKLIGNEKFYLVSIADETPHYHIHLLPKMKGDAPLGRHIMGDAGWKGEVGNQLSAEDIAEFVSCYREL